MFCMEELCYNGINFFHEFLMQEGFTISQADETVILRSIPVLDQMDQVGYAAQSSLGQWAVSQRLFLAAVHYLKSKC